MTKNLLNGMFRIFATDELIRFETPVLADKLTDELWIAETHPTIINEAGTEEVITESVYVTRLDTCGRKDPMLTGTAQPWKDDDAPHYDMVPGEGAPQYTFNTPKDAQLSLF